MSLYFGIRHSHPHLNDPELAARIALVRELSFEEGMRQEMHLPLREVAATQASWTGSGVPLVRFEELVADEAEGFGRLLGHCGIAVSDRQLCALIAPASFEARGGRSRGVEDRTAHNRKGIVGDWRNHLEGALLDEFKDLYDDVLVETGYEASRDWGASPRAVMEGRRRRWRIRGRRPRCWCGSARLTGHSRGFDRCARCGTLVNTLEPEAREPVGSDRVWTEMRFHHGISHPQRAWRGAPLDRRRDAWNQGTLERLDVLLEMVPAGGRVLDAAAGTGAFAAMLREAGFAVTAAEPSAAAATHARERWGLPVEAGSALDLPGPFDAIVIVDLLHRLADPLDFLSSCAARLGPSGIVLIDQPLRQRDEGHRELRAAGSPDLDLLRPEEYAFVFTESSLDRLVSRSGLSLLHTEATLRVAGAQPRSHGPADWPARPAAALLEATVGLRADQEMAGAGLIAERALIAEQQREHLESRDQRLVDDHLALGAGWHALEHDAAGVFRWAGEDAEIAIGNPSGRRSALLLEIEPGPGVGGREYDLELLGPEGTALARVPGPPGRQEVHLDCPVRAGAPVSVRLRATPGGLSTPGEDARVLNLRLFRVGWA